MPNTLQKIPARVDFALKYLTKEIRVDYPILLVRYHYAVKDNKKQIFKIF